ncbi:BnaA01g31220D [Brassica napus]|uniref:BnaA01g31220D protein n=1 Tax=Brassica napus TaxID=3708 RepID=A0A078HEV2_BRANA|nr:BnaA01g31220D [Brassica napus]
MKGFWNLTSTISFTLSILFLFGYNYEDVSAVPTKHLCRPDQRDALLQFKNEFEVLNSSFAYHLMRHPKTESWRNNSDCCTWEGIKCNVKSGEVIELDLSCSYLGGRENILSSIIDLSYLTFLDLSWNLLSGQIPSSIGNLSHLTHLNLNFNQISEIPSSFGNLNQLTSLDVSINKLNGSFSIALLNLTKSQNMEWLDISNNKIKGQVPGWLWTLPNLTDLNLSNNTFTGFGNSMKHGLSMEQLFASNNNFTGNIPSFICDLRGLSILDLSNNNFSGVIPPCMENLYLTVLSLRQNRLHGGLPENIFVLLTTLDVGHNKLTGKLPKSLIYSFRLEVLNVESNFFNDTFPFWLSSLPQLKILVLRSNAFHGPIDHTSFPKLQIVDISHNHFNGSLPSDYFERWSGMSSLGTTYDQPDEMYMGDSYYQDSMVLMNKGLEMELVRILKIYTALDFSGNKFEGEIPRSIGLLKELHVLNLSNNAFTGHIPSSMGNLTALESLDVSQNQLSGEIPQELGSLSFLSYMNFSHNQLTGLVPGGTQFQRLNCTSFDGNPGLSGPSLDEICRNIHISTPHETPQSEEEEEEEVLSWIAAVIGVIPGIAFGWVIGYILFSYKPEWFINPFARNKRRISSTTTH